MQCIPLTCFKEKKTNIHIQERKIIKHKRIYGLSPPVDVHFKSFNKYSKL
jgi:hypothetical protein